MLDHTSDVNYGSELRPKCLKQSSTVSMALLLIRVLVLGLALLLPMAAASSTARDAGGSLPVSVVRNGGLVSLRLSLLRQKRVKFADGIDGLVFQFGGTLNGKPVGMFCVLVMKWEQQQTGDTPFSFWWSSMSLERSGASSDDFVRLLAGLYGVKKLPQKAKRAVALRVVSLDKRPTFDTRLLHLKAFIDADGPADYGELYVTVDFPAATVTIAENDPEYRSAIVRALSE